MSSLIFHTDENQAFVATDTLVTSPDGRPFKFTTKAFILPHLKLIIAGTGAGGFLARWFVRINDAVIAQGVEDLDCYTPRILASMWPEHKQKFAVLPDITATVYHFGFSEISGLTQSFAYRSSSNFQSERLPYGLGAKPECPLPENWSFPSDVRKMMDAQRAIQSSKLKQARIHIGGEIEIHHLFKVESRACFQAYTLDRFEDYARDETAIYDNFRDSKRQEP